MLVDRLALSIVSPDRHFRSIPALLLSVDGAPQHNVRDALAQIKKLSAIVDSPAGVNQLRALRNKTRYLHLANNWAMG